MSGRTAPEWLETPCMLCHANCGLAVQLDPSGRQVVRIEDDKNHIYLDRHTCIYYFLSIISRFTITHCAGGL
jgi:hypothetical protein